MAKLSEAQIILKTLGMPPAQYNEMSGFTLLALCGLKPKDSWAAAKREPHTVTKGVMDYIKTHFNKGYAPNTRETFRRQVLHQFVQGHIADYNAFTPDLPTNSPRAHYAVTEAALAAIKTFGTPAWDKAAAKFVKEQGALLAAYQKQRDHRQVPIQVAPGKILQLSPGKHNEVQRAIVEQFAPRFAPGAHLLYLGDTAQKDLYSDAEGLAALGILITQHDKLPDVVLHDRKRGWLFLIEAVTSHGPMSPKRVLELGKMFKDCPVGLVHVSAFPDAAEFRRHVKDIAWETEVWLADVPDHMIHFNGDRFMGPRNKD